MTRNYNEGIRRFNYTYASWLSMRKRVAHPEDYPLYEGISICPEWDDYEVFLSDMGERPPGTTIDRFPNGKGNYEPSNCRWATPEEQSNNLSTNVRVEAFGKTLSVSQWVNEDICSVTATTIKWRLDAGWTPEDAITTPSRQQKREAFGEIKTLKEWLKDQRCLVGKAALNRRLSQGESLEEAMSRPVKKVKEEKLVKEPFVVPPEIITLWVRQSLSGHDPSSR